MARDFNDLFQTRARSVLFLEDRRDKVDVLYWPKFCTQYEQTSALGLVFSFLFPYDGKIREQESQETENFQAEASPASSLLCGCHIVPFFLLLQAHWLCSNTGVSDYQKTKQKKKTLPLQLRGLAFCFLVPPKYYLYSLVP